MKYMQIKVEASAGETIKFHLEECKEVAKMQDCEVLTSFNWAQFIIEKDSDISEALEWYRNPPKTVWDGGKKGGK